MAGKNPDVKLLFGAAEGSFGQISDDLAEIVNRLDKDPIRVKVGLRIDEQDKAEWHKQISAALADINQHNDFSIQVSEIKLSESALANFRQRLNETLCAIGTGGGIQIGTPATNAGAIGAEMTKTADAAQTAATNVANLQQQIQKAVATAANMDFGIRGNGIQALQSGLVGLQVDPTAVRQMAEQLDNMHVSVKSIHATFEATEDAQAALLRLVIAGTDEQKRQLQLVQTYNTENGKVKTTIAGITANIEEQKAAERKAADEVKKVDDGMRNMLTNIRAVQASLTTLDQKPQELVQSVGNLNRLFADVAGAKTADEKVAAYARLNEELRRCMSAISKLKTTESIYGKAADEVKKVDDGMRNMPKTIEAIKSAFYKLSNQPQESDPLFKSVNSLNSLMNAVNDAKTVGEKIKAYASLRKEVQYCRTEIAALNSIEDNSAQLDKVSKALAAAKGMSDKWSSAQYGDSATRAAYADLQKAIKILDDLEISVSSSVGPVEDFGTKFKKASDMITTAKAVIQAAGRDTQSLGDRMLSAAKKFGSWLSVSQVIMVLVRAMKQMVTTVIEIDTAMTELRKVTDETEAAYTKFLTDATQRAKRLGTTISDVVTASADFARLGYSIDEASQLADAAIVYKNVGDGIENISTASESIISTMKAFKIEAGDAMLIVDKFNKIGNEFPISSQGVGEALKRSAAALDSAGNSLDESIALITAANTIVQDPDSVGEFAPNNTVMYCKKIAISVKDRRRFRPRKDFVMCSRRVRSSTSFM